MRRYQKRTNVDMVDRDTGELLNGGTHEGWTQLPRDAREPITFREGSGFMKVFNSVLHELGRRLTPSELSFLVLILEYVSYTDCVIRYGGDVKGEIMGLQDMSKATEMDYTRVTRIVGQLECKGVMGHHVTGSILKWYEGKARKVYTVNPHIFCKGKYVNGAVAEFYAKSGWDRE